MTTDGLSRRHALTGVATVGLGLPLLAACGGSGSGTASDSSSSAGGGGAGSGTVLTTTDKIEVGGGTIFADQQVVVTQPTEGDFKGFSAICTHQGCTVGSVSGGSINCPCHGSQFSIEDGSVQTGPATSGLPAVDLTVKGQDISLA
jgi:Rieske Fe-S protein